MWDTFDFVVGIVPGHHIKKQSHVINNSSRTVNDAKLDYSITEKESLTVVFVFEKFRSYLIGLQIIIHIDMLH